jgi:lipopolysaccharide export system protein LptC
MAAGSGMNALAAPSEGRRTGPRVFAQSARRGGERAFRAARRHSRHVRFLRIAIPTGLIVAVAGAFVVASVLNPLRLLAKMPVDLGSLVVSGSKIMMQQPKIAGFTRDNRRYNLTAQAAGQDLTKPDLVELQGIQASMEMQDSAVFQTTAQRGFYNTKTEQLTLSEQILVKSTSGYEAQLQEAVVDVRDGKIISERPVEVRTATWTINANRMEVAESGDLMRFERGVTVLLQPETAPAATASASDGRGR